MHLRRIVHRAIWPLAVGGCLLALSGCATTHAKAPPDALALDMPAPPPRAIDSVDTEPPPLVPMPEEPTHSQVVPITRKPASPPPRPEANRQEPPKTDPPVPPPPESPKPVEEPKPPPPTLQTTPPDAERGEEQKIRGLLSHATSDLNRIDYQRLSPDARTQYNTAKRFIEQAEDSLQSKNLVFARSFADKAAALAAQLAGK